jgi:two-component system, OmpR family, sensor histidine kinase BaeS
MSLRWRIAIGFALVALATAAVIALVAPPIITQGFSDFDTDNDAARQAAATATPAATETITAEATVTPRATAEPRETDESDDNGGDDDATPRPTARDTAVISIASPTPAPTPTSAVSPAPAVTASTVAASQARTGAPDSSPEEGGTVAPLPPSNNAQAQTNTIIRLILAALAAAAVASLLGLFGAGRLVRPLTRLELAAEAVARGDLGRRSGLADRSDEFGQLGRSFDSMAGELQVAEQKRRRFLQDAAHELRTPLAVIEATSSAILDGVYTAERRHIETIRDQSRVLARVVDDLRTISLAEDGHLHLERRPLDARALLDSVAAGFEARAAAGSVALAVEGPGGVMVDADPDRLRQIVGALVDNALRHTPDGGSVQLNVSGLGPLAGGVTGKASAARQMVRFAVEDTGPGIPAEALPRVFERFYQADPSRSRGTGTSGLGLSIVRALAEAHGGRAGAENLAGGGARLWVELPAGRPERQD